MGSSDEKDTVGAVPRSRRKGSPERRRARRTGIAVIAAGLLWYFRTWFHDAVFLVYTQPILGESVVAWLLLHRFVLRRSRILMKVRRVKVQVNSSTTAKTTPPGGQMQAGAKAQSQYTFWEFRWLWTVSVLVLALVLTLGLMAGMWARSAHLASTLRYEPVAKLPESAASIRLTPLEVAYRYARDSLQLTQYRVGKHAIGVIGGRLAWQFPLIPDGLIIKFSKKGYGLMYVDASHQNKNARIVKDRLAVAAGLQLTDNLWWRVYRQKYFVGAEKPYYAVTADSRVYTVVPVSHYRYYLYWGLLYTAPEFAGVFLVASDGGIRFLTPAEALASPVLAGNRIFPERLARIYAGAYSYRKGTVNRLLFHEDQIKIEDVVEEEGDEKTVFNRQPFLMETRQGLKWFISAEPYGHSRGIFKVFLIDARTGELGLFTLPADRILTGAVRAIDYVRRENPSVDWSRFRVAEPLPFVKGGDLFWKLAVIPRDGAGIAYQVFVDAANNQVYHVKTDEEIAAFVTGGANGLAKLAGPAAPAPAGTAADTNAAAAGVTGPANEDSRKLLNDLRTRLREMERTLDALETKLR